MIEKEMNTLRSLLLLKVTKSELRKIYNLKRYVFHKLLKSLRQNRKYTVINIDAFFTFITLLTSPQYRQLLSLILKNKK